MQFAPTVVGNRSLTAMEFNPPRYIKQGAVSTSKINYHFVIPNASEESEYIHFRFADSALFRITNDRIPYRIFKVELTDLENGDRGEGFYYMEKENYIK